MKILVTYQSRTGFTKKYVQWIAEELDCTVIAFKDMTEKKMSEFDVVVFGSGLRAGLIGGLKKAKIMFEKSGVKNFIVFATGATPYDAKSVIAEVWKNNLSPQEITTIPHFYMPGGICYEKMSLPDKLILKMAAKMLTKKMDSVDNGFNAALNGSYDMSSRVHAQPLVQFLQEL